MKPCALAVLVVITLATSCEAGPQRPRRADTVRARSGPGVKVIGPDSPAGTRMLVRTDTTRQANMPVVTPPKNVQPK